MAETGAEKYIVPLTAQGMRGRLLHIPGNGKKQSEILVLYGHHALLERWWGLVQNFSEYGTVTMPDLPGFGGMETFYKVGKQPTLDNYADYLAGFVNEHYGKKRFSVVAISFGFLVVTRMLQRHPEMTDRVDLLVSAAGFMHRTDFTFTKLRYWFYIVVSKIMVVPPMNLFFRYVILNRWVLRLAYGRTNNAKYKFAQVINDPDQFNKMMAMEIELWQKNEVRTYMKTTTELLTVDNTTIKIKHPVWHVYSKTDHFFDGASVEKHMRMVYADFYAAPMNLKTHTLSVLATKEESATLLPDNLRRAILRSL